MRRAQRWLLGVAVTVLLVIAFAALWPAVLATHDPLQTDVQSALLPPGAESSKSYSHEGEEVGLVLEGQVDFWVGERHFTLNAGDSISYASHEPHRYRNTGITAAVVIWAISPPSF